jgi:hypothetical protein
VASFTVQTSRDVWAVVEINEIRHDENRYPFDRRVAGNRIRQFLLIGVLDWDLLVAAPTLGDGG